MKSIWTTRQINLFTVGDGYKKGSVDVQTYFGRIFFTSWFVPRVRARALRTPVILGSIIRKTGRCAPPIPPFAASLILNDI
jgi:hypothetical protein